MDVTRMWNLAPPTGFQGLRDDIPMRVYLRHMPHWRQAGATYFVTFRLDDSIPENRLRELESLKKDWGLRNPPPRSNQVLQQLARTIFEKIEYWLDQGTGSCLLKDDRCATIVQESLQLTALDVH